jgi:hypothetical protein
MVKHRQHDGGRGTVYTQQGGTGSCGQKHTDGELFAALSYKLMGDKSPSPLCGHKIKVTNVGSNSGSKGKGTTLTVPVVDTCPGCDTNDVDFSVGAWKKLTNDSPFGTIVIDW